MIVRRYESQDFEQIKEWGKEFGSDYKEDQFPKTGFIVDGIAAYFLYSTDSSVCWLENMISKRGVDQRVKNQALELIIEAILKEAKELGFRVAYASTDNYIVAKRSIKHGAKIKPGLLLMTKELSGPSNDGQKE